MAYAEVSVNSPAATRPAFSYRIPVNLEVGPGQAVWVPFGEQVLQGIVVSIGQYPEYPETRDIADLIDSRPLLSATALKMATWLSRYYRCPLFQALELFLPPGFTQNSLCYILPTPGITGGDQTTLDDDQSHLLARIEKAGGLSQKQIEKDLGVRRAQSAISGLLARKLVERRFKIQPRRVSPKLETVVNLAASRPDALLKQRKLEGKAPRQAAILAYLLSFDETAVWSEIRQVTGSPLSALRALAGKGWLTLSSTEVSRRTVPGSVLPPEPPLEPVTQQARALATIRASIESGNPDTHLLYGVTGSGKTEVYLQALASVIHRGKRAIVLVPEISLTPQTVQRFTARFPNQVAVLHSKLGLGERFDQWRDIQAGKYQVVVGARSALFAPQPDLGLIIMDEEHEWSYKQDVSPRYHARTVAAELGKMSGATLLLGSATPDIESFHRASNHRYSLIRMPERIAAACPNGLPGITVVDLRRELKAGNRSIFSRRLQLAMKESLKRHEQVILYLNRRGGATFIQCRTCGHVIVCRRCQVPMSYHFDRETLVCHHCNYRLPVPSVCPGCGSRRIKYLGLGTQAVARDTTSLLPDARILRWDSDTTRARDSHQGLLEDFRSGKADILIGTQMIAKGLEFPGVSLVGVVNADTGLNLPDFRAGERTFSLLSQVAGRAGRGLVPGEVIIQSYWPEHYAIQAAAKQDYTAFYRTEIEYRRQLNLPPFSSLIRLTFYHRNDDFCRREAFRLKTDIQQNLQRLGMTGVSIVGPAPAFIHRLRGLFRWNIFLKGRQPELLLDAIQLPRHWRVDVDPVGLE